MSERIWRFNRIDLVIFWFPWLILHQKLWRIHLLQILRRHSLCKRIHSLNSLNEFLVSFRRLFWLLAIQISLLLSAVIKSVFAGISSRITDCSCNTRPWACLLSLTRKKVDRSSINNSTATVDVAHFSIVDLGLEGLYTCAVVDTAINRKCDVLVLRQIVVLSFTSSRWRLLGTYNFLDVLRMLFSLNQIKLLQTFMKLINVWNWLADNCLAIVFAEFVCEILFLGWMEKGAYLWFITS